MSFLESQSQAWDSAHWEYTLVFENLADEDLWRRAHPNLLSVGELTAHVCYGLLSHAQRYNPNFVFESPLMAPQVRYYLHNVSQPLVLPMTVAELEAEFDRVQKAAKAALLELDYTRETPMENGPGDTFGQLADYMVFHVAYHTGQAFSVRHLMGHTTNDN